MGCSELEDLRPRKFEVPIACPDGAGSTGMVSLRVFVRSLELTEGNPQNALAEGNPVSPRRPAPRVPPLQMRLREPPRAAGEDAGATPHASGAVRDALSAAAEAKSEATAAAQVRPAADATSESEPYRLEFERATDSELYSALTDVLTSTKAVATTSLVLAQRAAATAQPIVSSSVESFVDSAREGYSNLGPVAVEASLEREHGYGTCELAEASIVIVTEEGIGMCFYYPYASRAEADVYFNSWRWRVTSRIMFKCHKGTITEELCTGGLGMAYKTIRKAAQTLVSEPASGERTLYVLGQA